MPREKNRTIGVQHSRKRPAAHAGSGGRKAGDGDRYSARRQRVRLPATQFRLSLGARLLLVSGLALAPLVASCGGSGGDYSVSELQRSRYSSSGGHQGDKVVVHATVAAVHGPAYFELSDGASSRTRLTVMTSHPASVHVGEVVRVTGTAGQVRLWSPSGRLPYLQDKLQSQRQSMAYVYDAAVSPMVTSD